jgi:Tol biopolymer transport system component
MHARKFVAAAVITFTAATAASSRAMGAAGGGPRYGSDRPFRVVTHGVTFGQAPVVGRDGTVVFHDDAGDGEQIYASRMDGSHRRCITCAIGAPNMVPQLRPEGDAVLFHSWHGHTITVGAPGFGGLGADVWVTDPRGRHPVDLTPSPDGEDNYHAYWSPDGRRIVWAHLNWDFVTDGGTGRWDVRVADYVPRPQPHLANVRVVRPPNGHFYETQWWAPDGSGFLYTESTGNAMNLELFFCRLTSAGCEPQQLTNDPSWDEQAVFTPDGRSVVFMSARGTPSFWNAWAAASWNARLPAGADFLLTLPLFEAGFLQPVAGASTDLYQVDPQTLATRRLTYDGEDGWITPEFAWDPSGSWLLWTESRFRNGVRTPIPVDATRQATGLADLLRDPPLPNPHSFDRGRPSFLLEARTRIGRFA